MSTGATKERPPYVQFHEEPVEYRDSAELGGAIKYRMVDMVEITPVGDKNKVVREVEQWLKYLDQQANLGRYNPEWIDYFRRAYRAWKEKQEMPVNGTPIRAWPAVTAGEVKALEHANLRTVEDLAQAGNDALTRVGMGARSLQNRAKDWLAIQESGSASLVVQVDALKTANAELTSQIKVMSERLRAFEAASRLGVSQQVASAPSQHYDGGGVAREERGIDRLVDEVEMVIPIEEEPVGG